MSIVAAALGLGALAWLSLFFRDSVKRNAGLNTIPKRNTAGLTQATDYTFYKLNLREWLVSAAIGCGLLFAIGFVFYKNVIFALVFASLGFMYPKYCARLLRDRRTDRLNSQFKQLLYSLSSSLSAGRSMDNAFAEAAEDLAAVYPSPETEIRLEVARINLMVSNGETLEAALWKFSQRSGSEDVRSFCEVFAACRRSGVNLVEVIRRTANLIADKLEIRQEIGVLLAQKKFESKVLSLSPLLIVSMLSFSSADYMAPLYVGLAGPILMTFCLTGLAVCFLITQKIMDIKV